MSRDLKVLATKLKIGPHEGRDRSRLIAQRVLELGLDRRRE